MILQKSLRLIQTGYILRACLWAGLAHLFAAAVPVCGGGDVSMTASIKHIPIWIFHGAESFHFSSASNLVSK